MYSTDAAQNHRSLKHTIASGFIMAYNAMHIKEKKIANYIYDGLTTTMVSVCTCNGFGSSERSLIKGTYIAYKPN